MTDSFFYPEWLEEKRVADELCARSYAEVPATFRGAIKTGIALADFYFRASDEADESLRESPRLGFSIKKATRPADWAMLVFDAHSVAQAKICSAAILPALAGVKNIFTALLGDAPPFGLLATLELCGADEIFHLAYDEFEKLLEFLRQMRVSGRIVLYGGLTNIASHSLRGFKNYWCDNKNNIFLQDKSNFALSQLEFLYGEISVAGGGSYYDCVLANNDSRTPPARLVITPGCEGFWLHENLTPAFFRISESCCAKFAGENNAMC